MVRLENWHRIEKLVKWTGLSVNAFARNIGLNRGENLYQIKRGNNGISKELAELITAKYPGVSKAWLLTGEGEPFLDSAKQGSQIPYFEMDALQFVNAKVNPEPTCRIVFPIFRDCDFAAIATGNAMTPPIPNGAVIFCRETSTEKILPGEDYLIVGKTFCGIRTVRREPDEKLIRLVPRNREDYDELTIDPKEISKIYLIRGVAVNRPG